MAVLATTIPKPEAIAHAVAEQVPIVRRGGGGGPQARATAQAFRALAGELWPAATPARAA